MDATQTARKPYPSDVSDDERAFVAPYLALMREDAPQREHTLREVFNGLRWIVRAGGPGGARARARASAARGVHRPALDRAGGGPVADAAERSAPMAHGLPANAALARGG